MNKKPSPLLLAIASLCLTLLACSPVPATPPPTPTFPATKTTVPSPISPIPALTPPATSTSPATTVTVPSPISPPAATAPPATVPPKDACSHPYLPVVVGARWSYEMSGVSSDTFTQTILSRSGDGFTEQHTFTVGTVRTGQWRCQNGNLIALTPGVGMASVGAGDLNVQFTVTYNDGVTLPAGLNVGSAWTQAIHYETTQDLGGTSITGQGKVALDCKAVGRESVTVPAGTFDALRVECNTQIDVSIAGVSALTITQVYTAWYAEGVGLVKSVGTGSNMDTTIVLTQWNIP